MKLVPLPQSCEELLGQMVAIETVNPDFGGPIGGEAKLAAHLENLAPAVGPANSPVCGRKFRRVQSFDYL